MRRAALLAAGVILLGAAVWLRPVPPSEDATAALGRSMGGVRVMVIDGLFLRAESRRKAGRIEEAATLYRTVLELDPDNEAAVVFLAATYVQELLPQVPESDERLAWWREARGLLQDALARNPGSGVLNAHLANLILDAPLADAEFEKTLAAEYDHPRLVALRHLARAMRATGTLPRLGRNHLVRLALLAPDVAAEALHSAEPLVRDEALRLGREALALRGELLRDVATNAGPSLAAVLEAGLQAVAGVQAARAGTGDEGAAVRAIQAFEALIPDTRTAETLRLALAGKER